MSAPTGNKNRALGEEPYDKRIQIPVSDSKNKEYKALAKSLDTTLPALIRGMLDRKIARSKSTNKTT